MEAPPKSDPDFKPDPAREPDEEANRQKEAEMDRTVAKFPKAAKKLGLHSDQ